MRGPGASSPGASGPVVVLVGAPGSGKTAVGRALAECLEASFRDTDSDVEARAGQPIADIFANEGEAVFRELERDAVASALGEHVGVLSLGGGAVIDPATRESLRGHRVAWLRVSPAVAVRRVGLSAPRPVLLGNVRARFSSLLRERTPLYEDVATWTVDTDELTPNQVAQRIKRELVAGDGGTGARRGA